MAHLWLQDKEGEWIVRPLDDCMMLLDYDGRDLAPGQRDDRKDRNVIVERVHETIGSLWTATSLWILTAGRQARVRVNGAPLFDRFRLLQDRDEIATRTKLFYFAANSPPMVAEYRGPEDQHLQCSRCGMRIEPFTCAVCCPKCESWHHESQDNPCWTTCDSCAVCSQSTDLNREFDWRPEKWSGQTQRSETRCL